MRPPARPVRDADSAGVWLGPIAKDTCYRYRDWVIEAFNRNEPYDQFIIDQVAGDLREPPDDRSAHRDSASIAIR